MLEYIILGFLMRGEKTGYDLKQWMTNSTSYFFDASFGSIYPALKRMEEKDLINSHEVVEGSKYKKVYSINESGKAAFMKWIGEPIVFAKVGQDHLVKIFFYEFVDKGKAVKNLKAFIEEVEVVLKKLSDQKDEVAKTYEIRKFLCRYSTMEYGIEYYQFVIRWCNNLIKKLEG